MRFTEKRYEYSRRIVFSHFIAHLRPISSSLFSSWLFFFTPLCSNASRICLNINDTFIIAILLEFWPNYKITWNIVGRRVAFSRQTVRRFNVHSVLFPRTTNGIQSWIKFGSIRYADRTRIWEYLISDAGWTSTVNFTLIFTFWGEIVEFQKNLNTLQSPLNIRR